MSVKESLWKINIPFRLCTYLVLYIGLMLSMISVFIAPYGILIFYIGTSMIFLSTLYLCIMLYRAGFRRHAVILLVTILALCAVSVAAMLFYKQQFSDF